MYRVLDNRYEVEWKVGQGGAAEVYRAVDLRLGRVVALKVLRAGHAQDEKFRARFINEARAAARLSHPNIVDVYDYDEVDGTYFIAMEYVDGKNLKEYIRERGRLSEGEAIRITEQILEGLSAAHRAGLVHRDMKPQNVMVTEGGVVKITDFGIAKAVGDAGMTEAGVAFGTPHYLSPEQARGDEVTPRSDVYAVGVMMYEMLSGRLPFEGENPMRVAYAHVFEEPEGLREVAPWVSEGLVRVVERAMAKDPLERYGDAGEMLRDLRSLPLPADSHHNQDAMYELTSDFSKHNSYVDPWGVTASLPNVPKFTSGSQHKNRVARTEIAEPGDSKRVSKPFWILLPATLLVSACVLLGVTFVPFVSSRIPPIVTETPDSNLNTPSESPYPVVLVSTPIPTERTYYLRGSVPAPPENLTAVALSPYAIKLFWVDVSPNEDAYFIYRRTSGASWRRVAILGPNSISYLDKGLKPNTDYTYKVCAVNSQGSSKCPEASAHTDILPPTSTTYIITSTPELENSPEVVPTPTSTPTPEPTNTPVRLNTPISRPTATPTSTPTPTPTPTVEPTPTPTKEPTPTPTATSTPTPYPTVLPTPTKSSPPRPTVTPTNVPTPIPTIWPTPTISPTQEPVPTSTPMPRPESTEPLTTPTVRVESSGTYVPATQTPSSILITQTPQNR